MLRCFAGLFLLSSLALAFAQDDLYGPETPDDIAWIRVLNTGAEPVTAWIAGSELVAEPLSATSYTPVDPGEGSVEVQGEPVSYEAAAGQFLTLALTADGGVFVADPALRDVSRGLLGLMNLTERPALSLLTQGGDTVVSDVAPGEAHAVTISPAQTALLVTGADGTLAEVESSLFDRAQAYTVVVLEGENGVMALLLTASAE